MDLTLAQRQRAHLQDDVDAQRHQRGQGDEVVDPGNARPQEPGADKFGTGSNPFSATEATARTTVVTRYEGEETTNVAEIGDMIVVNRDKDGEILKDKRGRENTYVIRAGHFPELYEEFEHRKHGRLFKPREAVQADAIYLSGGFDIVPPWGTRQKADRGYLVSKSREVYGVQEDAFDKTYEPVSNSDN